MPPLPASTAVQEKLTGPAKLFTEATVIVAVLLTVAPPTVMTVAGPFAITLNDDAVRTTGITTEDTLLPLVPVTVTFKMPLVPALVLIVSVAGAAPPELSMTDGVTEHVPVAVLGGTVLEIAHEIFTVPTNGASETILKLSLNATPDTTTEVWPNEATDGVMVNAGVVIITCWEFALSPRALNADTT